MEFAPIVPIQYNPGDITKYHLILAHQVVQDNDYRDYYTSLSSEHTIILDNSVIELGVVDLSYVTAALNSFLASSYQGKLIVVAPDALRDRNETVKLHREFLRKLNIEYDRDSNLNLMVVPQGQNTQEWVSCLLDIYDFAHELVDYVGIPRLTEDFEGSRFGLVMEAFDWLHDKNVHLLGIQHRLEEVKWAKELPNIMGVDSSLPIRAAFANTSAQKVEDLRQLPDPDSYDEKMYRLVRLRIKECQTYVTGKTDNLVSTV